MSCGTLQNHEVIGMALFPHDREGIPCRTFVVAVYEATEPPDRLMYYCPKCKVSIRLAGLFYEIDSGRLEGDKI